MMDFTTAAVGASTDHAFQHARHETLLAPIPQLNHKANPMNWPPKACRQFAPESCLGDRPIFEIRRHTRSLDPVHQVEAFGFQQCATQIDAARSLASPEWHQRLAGQGSTPPHRGRHAIEQSALR